MRWVRLFTFPLGPILNIASTTFVFSSRLPTPLTTPGPQFWFSFPASPARLCERQQSCASPSPALACVSPRGLSAPTRPLRLCWLPWWRAPCTHVRGDVTIWSREVPGLGLRTPFRQHIHPSYQALWSGSCKESCDIKHLRPPTCPLPTQLLGASPRRDLIEGILLQVICLLREALRRKDFEEVKEGTGGSPAKTWLSPSLVSAQSQGEAGK